MIVKNESHIIRGTLEMLCSKIKFDYWVICDTGSTDSTREIITQVFKEKRIQGELHCDEWVDFAHNRTLALEPNSTTRHAVVLIIVLIVVLIVGC